MNKKRNIIIGICIVLLFLSVVYIYMLHKDEDYDYLRNEVFIDSSGLTYAHMIKLLSLEQSEDYVTDSGITIVLHDKKFIETEYVKTTDIPEFNGLFHYGGYCVDGYGCVQLNDDDLIKVNSFEYYSQLIERVDKYEYEFWIQNEDLSISEDGTLKVTAIINDKGQYNAKSYDCNIVKKTDVN